MRKIAITGVTAALALGLTACGGIGDGGGNSAAAPSSPTDSAPAPGGTSAPGETSAPGDSGGSGAPTAQHTPVAQGGQQIGSKWGRLRYLAPGKFTVGDVVFFTADSTTVIVAGGQCPDGSAPPAESSRCGIDGFDDWAKTSPHNVNVRFSGQAATLVQETQ
ncbi:MULTISPECIES: hypothetical protein [Thermomonosporaceae]|uniref:hypothetical protein n=1 Tax=Thermomonosporaceae TaxID=2012 RepID=UPI00255A78CF|nr:MULTISPECIES: hypothetical protein [Thermomonosporaceae]MDL4773529.1 hypothetical protein [Actinomadura xylanilytica]